MKRKGTGSTDHYLKEERGKNKGIVGKIPGKYMLVAQDRRGGQREGYWDTLDFQKEREGGATHGRRGEQAAASPPKAKE